VCVFFSLSLWSPSVVCLLYTCAVCGAECALNTPQRTATHCNTASCACRSIERPLDAYISAYIYSMRAYSLYICISYGRECARKRACALAVDACVRARVCVCVCVRACACVIVRVFMFVFVSVFVFVFDREQTSVCVCVRACACVIIRVFVFVFVSVFVFVFDREQTSVCEREGERDRGTKRRR
jgi:hypothetical protein